MDGEELVVGLRGNEISLRREQLEPHQRRRHTRDRKENQNRAEIENPDAFVIGCKQPRFQAKIDIEIMRARHLTFCSNVDLRRSFHFDSPVEFWCPIDLR